jgi:hypothetical protein
MARRFGRGVLWAAGLTGLFAAEPARAWDFEKPPGVPSEVSQARASCPTVIGPCFGYFNTRWRVLGPCCGPEAPLPMVAPAPAVLGAQRPARGAATERPIVAASGKMEVAPPKPPRVSVISVEPAEKSNYGRRRLESPMILPEPGVPLPEVRGPASR